jgi:hypothetical protein
VNYCQPYDSFLIIWFCWIFLVHILFFHTEITKGNGISQSSLLYVIFILKFIMVIPILLSDWLEFQISPSQKPYTW